MDRSDIVLLVSNAIAIILAVILHYDFAIVIWGYWLESVIIGFYTVVSMVFAGVRTKMPVIWYLAGAGFFIMHYGIFHAAYFVFLISTEIMEIAWTQVPYILLTGGIFFLSHGASFIEHTVIGGLKRSDKEWEGEMGRMLFGPYQRVVPMHLTIIASAFVMALVSGELASQVLVAVLMILKTGVDLASHRAKHKLDA